MAPSIWCDGDKFATWRLSPRTASPIPNARRLPSGLSTGDPIAYTVRVEEVVKGDADEQVEMTSARSSTSCGLEMSVGQRWRLYASGDNQLHVGVCSGSQLLADAVSPAEGDPHAAPAMVLLLALVFAMIRLLARF